MSEQEREGVKYGEPEEAETEAHVARWGRADAEAPEGAGERSDGDSEPPEDAGERGGARWGG